MTTLQSHLDEFNRQGFTVFRGAISEAWADELHAGLLQYLKEPHLPGQGDGFRTRMFERGEAYIRLIENEPIVDFAEALLGEKCHMFCMNAFTTKKGKGFDTWHVDEELFFPLPEGTELDERIQMPTYLITCIYYLVDVAPDMGPTQLIPTSHRSGQHPPANQDPPIYKGLEPVTINARKGDCLIFSGQTWHRGSTNQSDTDRAVQQMMYGKRWISQRFWPFINYVMPQDVIDYAEGNPRLRRLLGFHQHGPYG
ncbi:phytanoyl-CoA dioxygenase family protein [Paenibacillus sp. CF384]|uniref:phytanoyl-CoA dioxygenase family protein n=1 Tax=Paenibacillus sp. CF384 TaxID=1884382 RepID=UPI0008981A36|nr:phytanoyl-CoA dioxygenase family protein [Paenibacillus sp. CF384]SDX07166.1 Phytanoyl-CoA dioxygenase (PhyH) [Paenibacillus sp. CF384]